LALSSNLRGSLLMVIGMAGFTLNDSITKFVSAEISFAEIIAVRGVFATVLIAAFAFQQRAIQSLRVMLEPPVALRVAGEACGTLAFLAAIVHMPLGNVSAIMQALPLVVTMGAALVFGEVVGWRRWLAVAAGFAGVIIIVRPGTEGFNDFALLALVGVACYTVRDLATKKIRKDIPSLFITLLTTVMVAVAGSLMLMPLGGWTQPSSRSVGLLALSAVLLLVGYHFVILSLRTGELSSVAPFRYTALLWALALGYLVFDETPDAMTITGAAIIVGSGLYTLHRERLRGRAVASAAGGQGA